ncbi:hypothetical protein IFR05_004574 [Cadophora sp. M221]|nr:hypothetical protein IFR05_004574 [Cadophora sp. M221]
MSTHTSGSDCPTLNLSLAPTLPKHSPLAVESTSDSEINRSSMLELQSLVNNSHLSGDAEKTGLVDPSPEVNDAVDRNCIVLKKTINDLPVEVLMMIFDILEVGDRWYAYEMTCLGLSLSRLYGVLKVLHPGPICWRVGNKYIDSNQQGWTYELQFHIGTFLGPEYRPRTYDNRFLPWEANDVPFLRRSIYGDTFGEEKALNERYSDWKESRKLFSGDGLHPFGKGQDWFNTAFEILYCRRYDRGKPWGLHLHNLFAYQSMKFHYEEKYDIFREAAEMMVLLFTTTALWWRLNGNTSEFGSINQKDFVKDRNACQLRHGKSSLSTVLSSDVVERRKSIKDRKGGSASNNP